MLKQLLLIVTTIGIVCGQECRIFNSLPNDASLLNKVNGTFYKIFNAGTVTAANCQKQTFTLGPDNNLSGYFQSSSWCLRLDNCDTSNSTAYQCDLSPATCHAPPTLPSTQRNSFKFVREIKAGNNFCFLYAYCRTGEEGTYILCRQPPQFLLSLFLEVYALLLTLLGLIFPMPIPTVVKQVGCTFASCRL